MADTKLSALTAITSLDDADLLLTTDTSAAESKKITRANFVTDMAQATQTLTNKSIDQDGTGNSITNIANASIKAAAAIDVNKLAALTASEIAITDGSGFLASAAVATYPSLTELAYVKGVTSAVQTQLDAKGTLSNVSEDTTPTLGGNLAGGGFDVTGLGTVSLIEQAAANADVAGSGQIWVKTATPNQLWFTDDAGNDTQLGAGGTPKGTAILSTGETVGKVLQADGDNTCSWVTLGGGGDALVANPLSQFAATTSLELKNTISDETGSGALVFATSPTLVTPALGTPASGTLTNCTGLPAAGLSDVTSTAAELNILDGVTATTAELNYTDGVTSNIQTQLDAKGVGDALTSNGLDQFAATTSLELKGVVSDETGSGALVFGTSPTLVTPALGTPSSGVLTNCTGTASGGTAGSVTSFTPASGSLTLSGADAVTLTTTASTNVTLPTTGTLLANVSEDTTPQLGGPLDCQANSIGGTAQSATGDGTTTITWDNGNVFNFQFGAFNETFTFTAPTKPGTFLLKLVQDSVGSRTATWPAAVKWPAGTAPTLTTTATTGTDIITFYYDGTNYFAVDALNFS